MGKHRIDASSVNANVLSRALAKAGIANIAELSTKQKLRRRKSEIEGEEQAEVIRQFMDAYPEIAL